MHTLDDARNRERLAAAGNSQQHLIFGAIVQRFDKRLDCRRLIPFWSIFLMKFETHNTDLLGFLKRIYSYILCNPVNPVKNDLEGSKLAD